MKTFIIAFLITNIAIAQAPAGNGPAAPAGRGNGTAAGQGAGNQGNNGRGNAAGAAANGAGGLTNKAIEKKAPVAPAVVPGAGVQQPGAVVNPQNPLPVVENPYANDPQFAQPAAAVAPEILALRKKIFGSAIFNTPNIVWVPNDNTATPRDYTIGPNDQLLIKIWGYSQANAEVIVSPEGFVFVPKAGNVLLAGRTIEQAQKELIQRLSPFYLNLGTVGSGASTYLQVALGAIRTIRVQVLGQVITPGTYNISSLSTALNALYLTGGPNENGSFRNVQVVRRGKVAATVDLYEILTKGTLSSDMRLQDNDVVMVQPYKKRIEIKGEIKTPGIFEILDNESIAKAFEFANGFNQNSYTERVKVIGVTGKEHRILGIKSSEFSTYMPNNGDEVTIEPILARFENMVVINGAVYRPGEYSLNEAKTLMQLIKNADGLMGDAFTGRVNITRTLEDLSVENISVNLADIINGKANDIDLKREDEITIASKFDLREAAIIKVGGEVNKMPLPAADAAEAVVPPIEIQYSANMTLEDAIIKAGGFKESAATAQVDVVRRKRDVNVQSASAQVADVFSFNISRDLSIGSNDSQFKLDPFDEIIVRKSTNYQPQTFITLEGEVINPGRYGIKSKDEKLSDIIKRAGGLTPLAFTRGATLVRTVKLSEQEIQRRQKLVNVIANDENGPIQADIVEKNTKDAVGINLEKILDQPGGSEDMLLENDDVIRIPKRLETVRLNGELLFPTTVKYRDSNNFLDYVSQAGGFTKASLRRSAYVIYPNGSLDRTRKILFFNRYPRVEPGSEIVVPPRQVNGAQEIQQTVGIITATVQSMMVLVSAVLAIKAFGK